jgi:hypothetical protein
MSNTNNTDLIKIPVKLDLTQSDLELLNNDIKRLSEGLNKASKAGVFELKESQLLCTSIENLAQVVLGMTQNAKQTLENAKKVEDEKKLVKNVKEEEAVVTKSDPRVVVIDN